MSPRPLVIALSVLGLAAGCASSHSEIRDDWLVRVPKPLMSGVDSSRAALQQATDEVARAEAARADAAKALDVAKYEADAARARRKAAMSSVDAAKLTDQRKEMSAAEEELRHAGLAVNAAEAKVAWQDRVVAEAGATKTLREQQARLAAAELELAKYKALQESESARASELSGHTYYSRVADASAGVEKASRTHEERARELTEARRRWELAAAALQGYGGSGLTR